MYSSGPTACVCHRSRHPLAVSCSIAVSGAMLGRNCVTTRRDMHKSPSNPSAVNRFWPHRTIELLIRRLKTHPDRCRTGAGAQHLMGEL
jgi:hypothetical protein